jgi:hypothetical protein
MATIYKYEIPTDETAPDGTVVVSIPQGAEMLTAREQHGRLFVWARVDVNRPRAGRTFCVACTGQDDVPAWPYIGRAWVGYSGRTKMCSTNSPPWSMAVPM